MENTPAVPEPRKKVDEDWKKRAAEEKAKIAPPPAPPKTEKPAAPPPAGGAAPAAAPPSPAEEPPPAGTRRGGPFEMLVTMLVQQVTMLLGMTADPMTGERYQDLGQAKLLIDMLATLKVKTKGNLTAQEDRLLTGTLGELQMEFVHLAEAMTQQRKGGGPKKG